jgi:hypothetical protein
MKRICNEQNFIYKISAPDKMSQEYHRYNRMIEINEK